MEVELVRECQGTAIPAGNVVSLPSGTKALITQALGGNVTVRTDQGLFRIESKDVDALGDVDLDTAVEGVGDEEFSEAAVWAALKQCFDPEIPVNIVDLGLIYDMRIADAADGKHEIYVKMTLTAQGCGMGPVIAQDAKTRIQLLDGVENAEVDIVWDPVWNPQMISEDGRKILGLD